MTNNMQDPGAHGLALARRRRFVRKLLVDKYLYMMLFPLIVFLLIFRYWPMYGVIIAFKDFMFNKGILGSEWVGFKHFVNFISNPSFPNIMGNTILISVKRIIFGFPMPIILALLLNEVRAHKYRKTLQTVMYMPHFVSWIVLYSLSIALFSAQTGALTVPLAHLLGIEQINFLRDQSKFHGYLVISEIWKEIGFGSIIYISALTGVDQQLYEAAHMDGANRFQQIWHISLPCIIPVILILFILRMGGILDAGFEQVLMLRNPFVMESAEIIDTFVFTQTLTNQNYSYAAAVGLFKNSIGILFILGTNWIARRVGEGSLV